MNKQMVADHLQKMVANGKLHPDVVPELVVFIDESIHDWKQLVVQSLEEKVVNWEASMEKNDYSLYTLGLRHAIDEILGVKKGTYKPLGETDMRNFESPLKFERE